MRFDLAALGYAHARDVLAGIQRRSMHSRGQSLVEYALIIVMVALVVLLALSLLAPTLNSIFRSIPPAL